MSKTGAPTVFQVLWAQKKLAWHCMVIFFDAAPDLQERRVNITFVQCVCHFSSFLKTSEGKHGHPVVERLHATSIFVGAVFPGTKASLRRRPVELCLANEVRK